MNKLKSCLFGISLLVTPLLFTSSVKADDIIPEERIEINSTNYKDVDLYNYMLTLDTNKNNVLTKDELKGHYGWVKANNKCFIIAPNGLPRIGYYQATKFNYYFDKNGVMQTGLIKHNKKYIYFSPVTGRQMYNKWYLNKDTKDWYYIDENGYVITSKWIKYKEDLYYLNSTGKMVTGWNKIGNYNYYFSKSTGKLFMNKWLHLDNEWYYVDNNGRMKTGWLYWKNKWYYLVSSGKMKVGWLKYKDNWYYLNADGDMAVNTWVDDTHYMNSEGVWDQNAKKTPSGYHRLNVKNIMQKPTLPNGCEVTSLDIVLQYMGFSISKENLSDNFLPKGPIGSTSPYAAFVGNPRYSSGWYCYSPVIVKCANSYFNSICANYEAVDLSGSSVNDLFLELEAGRPVIVWATLSMGSPRTTSDWVVNGKHYTRFTNLHCLVLTGYDKKNNIVYIADPLRGNVTYNLSTFESRYKSLFSQAVVIKEKQK